MIETVDAVVFVRRMISGRTGPALCDCLRSNGEHVEVVVKEHERCDSGLGSLAREAIAACLAADLGLPVPEPFWVAVPAGLLPDDTASTGDKLAFGSRHVGSQFSIWTVGHTLSRDARQAAAAVFLFDAIIQNFDRRSANPNCLVRGDELRIIDHEATFIYCRCNRVAAALAGRRDATLP